MSVLSSPKASHSFYSRLARQLALLQGTQNGGTGSCDITGHRFVGVRPFLGRNHEQEGGRHRVDIHSILALLPCRLYAGCSPSSAAPIPSCGFSSLPHLG